MTGRGRAHRLDFTVSFDVYQQGFGFFNLGYASAIAYVLFSSIVGSRRCSSAS